jgi:hypothetical protein
MKKTLIPVFVGPSLPPEDRPPGPFEWRPPAAAGDMLKLIEKPPERLCLIDGYFDSRPAPWHKEILALMARGTLIFGASSMGALRAAELHRFGMIGVGKIFEAYRDRRLQGDDEVALIHADERLRWAPLSVPMVEVRATLQKATRARLLSGGEARLIMARIHDLYFADRDWPLIGKVLVGEGLISAVGFEKLERMHIPLKRLDALACLDRALKDEAPAQPSPEPPQTCFIRSLARQLGVPAP